jgi:ComF family protein
VAEPLGKLLFHALIRYPEIPAPDLVLPVPLHPSRAKRRGFNQAALLVKNWPKLFAARGLVPPRIGLDPRLIRRIQDTPAQTGLSRSMRKTNLRQAFAVHPKQNMEGLEILLVDDVATTGETVNECARILKKAGASGVNGLTLARAS